MLFIFLLRASRWGALFADDIRPRFSGTFLALMIGYLFNNILPARAGELARIHVIGRREQLSRSTALGTVVVERTLELLVMLAILAFVLFYQQLPDWAFYASKVVAILACSVICILIFLGYKGESIVEKLIFKFPFLSDSIALRILGSSRSFIAGVSAVLHVVHVARFILITVFIWGFEILFTWIVLSAFGLTLSVVNILFVMIAIALGTMVPSSPGYIGTFELFGLNALALIGVSGNGALAFIVVLHTVTFLGSSLIGAACLAYIGWPKLQDVQMIPTKESS